MLVRGTGLTRGHGIEVTKTEEAQLELSIQDRVTPKDADGKVKVWATGLGGVSTKQGLDGAVDLFSIHGGQRWDTNRPINCKSISGTLCSKAEEGRQECEDSHVSITRYVQF